MTTKFDPNAAASADSGIFGLPASEGAYQSARVAYLPVPWEATTSYGGGTSQGPRAILEASRQVDLYDLDVEKPYEAGLFMLNEDREIARWNEIAREEAQKVIEVGGNIEGHASLRASLAKVNEFSEKVNDRVYQASQKILRDGKILALVGGDHASPFGAIRAAAEKFPGLGILHFDAHSDTRLAYEGMVWSHASIMRNALDRVPHIRRIVQVGIRDYCEQEHEFLAAQGERAKIFFDHPQRIN
jgi:agmatinase